MSVVNRRWTAVECAFAEQDVRDVLGNGTEDGKLVSLLEKTTLSLQEGAICAS